MIDVDCAPFAGNEGIRGDTAGNGCEMRGENGPTIGWGPVEENGLTLGKGCETPRIACCFRLLDV